MSELIDLSKIDVENISRVGDIGEVESGIIHFDELPPCFSIEESDQER